MCNLQGLNTEFSNLSISLARSADIAGSASSLRVSAGVLSAQPFFSLESASKALSSLSEQSQFRSSAAYFEFELGDFVRNSALAFFLPIGLILRSFFATRKLGAAAMALAVSAYLIYPLFFLYSFTASQTPRAASDAIDAAAAFNTAFAGLPITELDRTSEIKDKISDMASKDFPGKVQPVFSTSSNALWLSASDLVLYPLISLIVSAVCALELYRMLSAPVFLPYFEAI